MTKTSSQNNEPAREQTEGTFGEGWNAAEVANALHEIAHPIPSPTVEAEPKCPHRYAEGVVDFGAGILGRHHVNGLCEPLQNWPETVPSAPVSAETDREKAHAALTPDEIRRHLCEPMSEWAELMAVSDAVNGRGEFGEAWRTVELAIAKSCLLSRMIYGGEKPSQTPCPVHKGRWNGIQMWGARLMDDGKYHTVWIGRGGVESIGEAEGDWLAEWRAQGCRCFQHRACACTTGWQPDEHCGCVPAVDRAAEEGK